VVLVYKQHLVANKIALGQIEVGIAGGVDTTSDAPIALVMVYVKLCLSSTLLKQVKTV
jgi:acetyl-CoA acetyltransferase